MLMFKIKILILTALSKYLGSPKMALQVICKYLASKLPRIRDIKFQ